MIIREISFISSTILYACDSIFVGTRTHSFKMAMMKPSLSVYVRIYSRAIFKFFFSFRFDLEQNDFFSVKFIEILWFLKPIEKRWDCCFAFLLLLHSFQQQILFEYTPKLNMRGSDERLGKPTTFFCFGNKGEFFHLFFVELQHFIISNVLTI